MQNKELTSWLLLSSRWLRSRWFDWKGIISYALAKRLQQKGNQIRQKPLTYITI